MSAAVVQKKDMHYWVTSRDNGNHYIGMLKRHAAANKWWKANKSNYRGYTFGQGSNANSFR